MKYVVAFLASVLCLIGSVSGFAQKSRLVKWKDVEELLSDSSGKLSVINFWATWCKPCIAELPHFQAAAKKLEGKPVRFVFISLDFAADQKSRLDPFVAKRLPESEVWLLDETDYNAWIDKVNPTWSGAIPATVFVNNRKKIRKFEEGSLSEDRLFEIINPLLQP